MAPLDYISHYACKRFKTAATEVWKAISVRRTGRIRLQVIKTNMELSKAPSALIFGTSERWIVSCTLRQLYTHETTPIHPLYWEERNVPPTVQNRIPDHQAHRSATHCRLHTWIASTRTEPRTCLSTSHRPIKTGKVQRQEINQPDAFKVLQRKVNR
jgi:hypothetical protein